LGRIYYASDDRFSWTLQAGIICDRGGWMKIFKVRQVLPQLYNIIVRSKIEFEFELIPYSVERLSLKKRANFFWFGLNQFLMPPRPLGIPVIAQVEPSNFCNLSCPLCLTTSQTVSRARRLMPFGTFKRFIDDVGDYLLLIVLWNWGEPFLNPDIFRMIKYAKTRDIIVHSSTNGNVIFDEARAEELVGSGIDTLIFGVDGATEETYRKYRKGGSLKNVIESIRTIVRVKERKHSRKPFLNLRFVVMQHNEGEIPLIKQLAADLGVDFLSFKTVDMPVARGADLDSRFSPSDPRYRRYEYNHDNERIGRPFFCMRPWKRITMDAGGEIIPCEMDYRNLYSFGNAVTGSSLPEVWKSGESVEFRKKFNKGQNDYYLCKDCTYKNRIADDCTIEKIRLK
jgi:radical SAM protein with 4Fe4S-binding SPASM domain